MSEDKTTKVIEYAAFGGDEKVKLTIDMIKRFIAVPSKSGVLPTEGDCYKFAMLCKSRGLNPFEGDAFMIGYDCKDGSTKFNLITAHQAFLKRAEVNPGYEGMESGIFCEKDGNVQDIEGDYIPPGAKLLGAWCRVFVKGRKATFKRLDLTKFSTGYGKWADNPAGMIVKCAEADALRTAFPTKCGGLYMKEELERINHGVGGGREMAMDGAAIDLPPEAEPPKSRSEAMAEKLKASQKREEPPASQNAPSAQGATEGQNTEERATGPSQTPETPESDIPADMLGVSGVAPDAPTDGDGRPLPSQKADPDDNTITGKIEVVHRKRGTTKAGKAYLKTSLLIGDEWFSTFDPKLLPESITKGNQIVLQWKQDGDFRTITRVLDIQPA